MADDSTDSAFGFIIFILFLALLGYAAGGVSSSPSTAGSTDGTYQSLPSLEGSKVSSCPDGILRQDEWDSSTSQSLNLNVWEDSMDRGRKCATATRGPQSSGEGVVKVTLAYTADQSQMVSNTGDQTASVEVTGTDDLCISAVAVITGTSIRVAIPKVVEPCMMTVPAMQPAGPMPVFTEHPDKIEDGY